MKIGSDTLEYLISDYDKRRQARIKIRKRCKDQIKNLERGDTVFLIDSAGTDTAFQHLSSEAEDHCVEADHLIEKHGRRESHGARDVTSNEDEVIEELEKAIDAIEESNRRDRCHRRLIYIAVGAIILIGVIGGSVIVDLLV